MAADGLVAYVVTFHQTILLAALIIAALSCVPGYFAVRKVGRPLLALVILFAGVAAGLHVGLSTAAGYSALSVEVIRIGRTPEDPLPPPAPSPS